MTKKGPEKIRAEDWAGSLGENWLANLDLFEGMIAPIGEAVIAAASPKRGEAVLDVGCGGGATTITLAKAVAPEGSATGLDISPALAGAALNRAAKAGIRNFSIITADATTARLQAASYDLIFSRFGVMFFNDPVAAFASLRRALKPTGRLQFACWAPPFENEWMLVVIGVLAQHLDLPASSPRAPGPFAFAEPDYVKEILSAAGFHNINHKNWKGVQYLAGRGSTPHKAAHFVINALSVGDIVRKQPPEKQAVITHDVEEAFKSFATPDGVAMKASAWIVSATPRREG